KGGRRRCERPASANKASDPATWHVPVTPRPTAARLSRIAFTRRGQANFAARSAPARSRGRPPGFSLRGISRSPWRYGLPAGQARVKRAASPRPGPARAIAQLGRAGVMHLEIGEAGELGLEEERNGAG